MRYLIGPELLWLVVYAIATLVAKANVPPSKTLDNFIENCWLYIPLLAGLTFALWWIPPAGKNGLLLRVWIACLVGGLMSLDKVMGAYSQQGPGIGTAYILGAIVLFVVLIAGSVFVRIRFG